MSAPDRRRREGATMLMGLFMALFLTGFAYLNAGISDAIAHREGLQDAADAGALAVAAVYARGMTRISQNNRVLQRGLVAATAMRALIERESPVCEDGGCARVYGSARSLMEQASSDIQRTLDALPERSTQSALRAVRSRYGDVGNVFAFAPGAVRLPPPPVEVRDRRGQIIGDALDYIEEHDLAGADFIVPIEGFDLSSLSGGSLFDPYRLHPIYGVVRPHNGIDMGAGTGTEVLAAGPGTVTVKPNNGGAGNTIEIDHGDGYVTKYFHLSGFGPGVSTGDRVGQGDVVGYVGSTGASTGPHLHFEVHENGVPVDPLEHLPVGGESGGGKIERSDVARAYATAASGITGPYALIEAEEAKLGGEAFQLRVAAVAELDKVDRTEAGALLAAFGEGPETGTELDQMRRMGRLGLAQAEYYGSLSGGASWHFRLRRFRLNRVDPGIERACAGVGAGGCAGLDAIVRKIEPGVVR